MKKNHFELSANASNYLSLKQVACLFEVTRATVRRWSNRGIITGYRHPVNNYRLFKVEDVEELLCKMKNPKKQ